MSIQSIELGPLTSATTTAAVATATIGLLAGQAVHGEIFSPDAAFAGSAKLQTSVDGTTWVDVGRALASSGSDKFMFTLSNYIRLNCTSRTAGTVRAIVSGSVS